MIDQLFKDLSTQMEKEFTFLKAELVKLRTGRANPGMVEPIKVECYGSHMPISQVASISVPDPHLIVIQPWDASVLHEIEKALQKSELGLSPQNDGKVIRVPVPPPTEERRKELVKMVGKLAEECRVALRSSRRDAMEALKKGEKDKKITEDDHKRAQTKVQEVTDAFVKKVDQLVETKSKELLAI